MRTLYVTATNNQELSKRWGFESRFYGDIYIRCNKSGKVDWNKSPVYKASELIERNSVKIVKK